MVMYVNALEAELWPFFMSKPFIEAKKAFFQITCFNRNRCK